MIAFNVNADLSKLKRELKALERQVVEKVIPRALNRTASNVRTKAIREIANEIGMRVRDVKEATAVVRATAKKHTARVIARGHPRNLIYWVRPEHRRVGAFRWLPGVVTKVGKNPSVYPGTFIGTGKSSGKLLVYKRLGKGRVPLETVKGPGLEKTFTEGRLQSVMRATASARFIHNMRREINFALRSVKS